MDPAESPAGEPVVAVFTSVIVPEHEEDKSAIGGGVPVPPTQSPVRSPAPQSPTSVQLSQEVQLPAASSEATAEIEKKAVDLGFYRGLIDTVHDSIGNELPVPEESDCRLDCCCQAIECIGLCCCKEEKPFQNVNDNSGLLLRGRSKGWLIHKNIVFPLASPISRTVWVAAELIILLVALGLSIARFSCGNTHVFNIVHLALSIFASVLGIFDVIVLFCGYDFKRCGCGETTQEYDPENSTTDATSTTQSKAQCCREFTRDAFDVGRMVLSELIFYPLLICAIFDMITFQAYYFDTEANRISFFVFLMSAILMLVFVYTVRIAVLISAIGKLRRRRSLEGTVDGLDATNTKSAAHIQNYFVFHAIGQMIVQMVIIAIVGILIYEENIHLIEDCRYDETIRVSVYLWYVLVSGYALPTLGLFSFPLLTYYWLQEFPIGITIDFLSILKLPNIAEKLEMEKKQQHKINDIVGHFNFPQLKQEFDALHDRWCCYKFIYPFQSPLMVIFSLFQLGLHSGFFTSAFLIVLAVDDINLNFFIFLCTAAIVVYIMNLYTFSVAVFWLAVISLISCAIMIVIGAVAAFIGLVILLFICLCGLGILGSNNNNN